MSDDWKLAAVEIAYLILLPALILFVSGLFIGAIGGDYYAKTECNKENHDH